MDSRMQRNSFGFKYVHTINQLYGKLCMPGAAVLDGHNPMYICMYITAIATWKDLSTSWCQN